MGKFFFILAVLLQLKAFGADPLLFTPDEDKKILIHNRILAKVNGKAISVYDVMKKMDMLFYRQFPEYTSSTVARYQFYLANWQHVLQDLVDKELIMADAEEVKMPVSNGDVRQEMELIFGPNIIANLDKVGLSYEEAWKMVHSDILIKRMLFTRANAKAIKKVTPQVILQAYDEFAKENMKPDMWVYNVITIRDPDKKNSSITSEKAFELLTKEQIPMKELPGKFTNSVKISVSDEMQNSAEEMAEAYKSVIMAMKPGEYSHPISQKSRADGSTVFRIFFFKEMQPGGAPPFNRVSNDLKNKLTEEASSREIDSYLKKMRKHFDVQGGQLEELKKENFQPFSLG